MKAFHFPDLGEGLHEAQIVEWHVAEGDEVAADDPLLSVETDKAVTEVPAPWKGRIAKLCAAVGDTIHVGDEVVRYEGGERAQATLRRRSSRARRQQKRRRDGLPLTQSGCAPCRRYASSSPSWAWTLPGWPVADRTAPFSPAISQGCLRTRGGGANRPSQIAGSAVDDAGWRPLSGVRRSMARNMERSRAEVVPATVHEEADVSAWAKGHRRYGTARSRARCRNCGGACAQWLVRRCPRAQIGGAASPRHRSRYRRRPHRAGVARCCRSPMPDSYAASLIASSKAHGDERLRQEILWVPR